MKQENLICLLSVTELLERLGIYILQVIMMFLFII